MALTYYLGLKIYNPKNLETSSGDKCSEMEFIALLNKTVNVVSKKNNEKFVTKFQMRSLSVDRRVCRHCTAQAEILASVEQYTQNDNRLSAAEVRECMNGCEAEIFACSFEDDMKLNPTKKIKFLFTVAQKYYVTNSSMECKIVKTEAGNFNLEIALGLKLSSWDFFMDRTPYSKVYLKKRLGSEVMVDMVKKYGAVTVDQNGWQTATEGIQNIYYEEKTGEKNADVKRKELLQPYLVQFNETEYQFLLRNASRCGEFLFFENGVLNFGLEQNANGKIKTKTDKDSYMSLKTVDMTNEFGQKSGFFMHNGNDYGDYRKNEDKKTEMPYVAEYANDEYFRPFKKGDNDSWYENMVIGENIDVTGLKDKGDFLSQIGIHTGWKAVEMVLAHQDTWGKMVSELLDLTLPLAKGELGFGDDASVAKSNNKSIDEAYFESNDQAQYSKDKKYYSQFAELYPNDVLKNRLGKSDNQSANLSGIEISMKARPSTALFFEMQKKENEVARSQYELRYDGLVEVALGDILELKSISDQKFVVVDVQTECIVKISVDEKNKEVKKIENATRVTVVPGIEEDGIVKFYPLPADVDIVRKSGAQTAVVVNNNDPLRQGRVRIKYLWQNDSSSVDEASPWVRVSYPYATNGSGIYSKMTVGDEVVVNYQNGNIELPYVSGAVFNSEHKVPFNAKGYSQVIRSSNGHMIGFSEGSSVSNLYSGLFASLPYIFMGLNMAGANIPMKTSDDSCIKKLVGGMVIRDTYGIYKISASSDRRSISISSPFGTVSIDAFTGITLSAPNGDINIKGKNVNIVANNNLTLYSGENIDKVCLSKDSKRKSSDLTPTMTSIAEAAVEALVNSFMDMPLLRAVFETFIRPVDGTLEIKSRRYLILNAGEGNAKVPISAFAKSQGLQKREKWLCDKVNELTYWYRDCADILVKYYHSLNAIRRDLKADFTFWKNHDAIIKKKHESFAEGLKGKTDEKIDALIDKYIKGTKSFDDYKDIMPNTANSIEVLKTEYVKFWAVDKDCGCFATIKDEDKKEFYIAIAKLILNTEDEKLKLFYNDKKGYMLKPFLLIKKPDNAKIADEMKKQIVSFVVDADIAGLWLQNKPSDEEWMKEVSNFIEALASKVAKEKGKDYGYMPLKSAAFAKKVFYDDTGIGNMIKSWNAKYSWQKDAMGQILLSQERGKTLSFNGSVIQNDDNTNIGQLKSMLLSPPFTTKVMIDRDDEEIEDNRQDLIDNVNKVISDLKKQSEDLKKVVDKGKNSSDKEMREMSSLIEDAF